MAEARKFLDQNGLDKFWEKVKAKVSTEVGTATNTLQGKIDLKADKSTTYTKTEVDGKIADITNGLASVLDFKGVKATKAELDKLTTGNKTGDVWHVTANSGEYVWDGSKWEELGSTIDLSGYVALKDLNDKIDARVPLTGVKVNGAALPISNKTVDVTIGTGTGNGTINVNGTDVSVKGLGSAAYTSSTAYATSAQGAKADTALQPSDIVAIPESYIQALS